MNKKLMLLGLCMIGAFSAMQADEPKKAETKEKTATKEKAPEKKKSGCGCKR